MADAVAPVRVSPLIKVIIKLEIYELLYTFGISITAPIT